MSKKMNTDKYKGFKIGIAGFLIAALGFLLSYVLNLELFGRLLVLVGIIIGFCGMFLHYSHALDKIHKQKRDKLKKEKEVRER